MFRRMRVGAGPEKMDGMDGMDENVSCCVAGDGSRNGDACHVLAGRRRRVRPQPHSPAPWRVILACGGRYHVGSQFGNRAGAWERVGSFDRLQDARLACLAPAMLVALQETLELLRGDVDAVMPEALEETLVKLIRRAGVAVR